MKRLDYIASTTAATPLPVWSQAAKTVDWSITNREYDIYDELTAAFYQLAQAMRNWKESV